MMSKLIRNCVQLTAILFILLIFQTQAGRSESVQVAQQAESILLSYLVTQGYTGATFPVGALVAAACPPGVVCPHQYFFALVPYQITGSDGGGMALVGVGTILNPNAGTVIALGGGAMTVDTLESYGVIAPAAQSLINQLNSL